MFDDSSEVLSSVAVEAERMSVHDRETVEPEEYLSVLAVGQHFNDVFCLLIDCVSILICILGEP